MAGKYDKGQSEGTILCDEGACPRADDAFEYYSNMYSSNYQFITCVSMHSVSYGCFVRQIIVA